MFEVLELELMYTLVPSSRLTKCNIMSITRLLCYFVDLSDRMHVYGLCGSGVAVLAILFYYELTFTVFTICVHLAVAALGIYLGTSWALVRGKQYSPPQLPNELKESHVRMVLQNVLVRGT